MAAGFGGHLKHFSRSALLHFAVLAAVAFTAAVIATLLTRHLAFLTFADHFVEDWETAALMPREPRDPNIVIVAVDETTLQNFSYRSPIDRHFLSDLIKTLAEFSPRAIGIDILFDQPTEPEKDSELRATLQNASVPMVVSYADTPELVEERQIAFENSYVPASLRASPTLATDQFDTVRWVYPGHPLPDGTYLDGFARRLAGVVGIASPRQLVPMAWQGRTAFAEYSAQLVHLLPPDWFRNKIVLIGTDLKLTDRHRTPFSTVFAGPEGLLAGVVIHAHGLAQLIEGRSTPSVGAWGNFAVVLGCALIGAMLPTVGGAIALRLCAGLALAVVFWLSAAVLLYYEWVMVGLIAPTIAVAMGHWAMEVIGGHKARRQREFVKKAFGHYVSPKVVEALIRDPSKVSLQGERRVMTFLFTDLANFTTMSEVLDSHQLASTMNAYFDGLSEIVLEYDGTIDKFEGDAVFIIFNAPVDQPDHPARAVHCALKIDRFAEAFRAEQNAHGVPFGHTRIGIHTGNAVVGNFGSKTRFDYSATGDAVNTAARIEGVNKQFGTRICVSDATRTECMDVDFRPLGSVVVKGKSKGILVWEPLHADDRRGDFLSRYRDAYAKLESYSPDAAVALASLNAEFPGDRCVALHLERINNGGRGVEFVLAEK